jgi:antitoxin VapB
LALSLKDPAVDRLARKVAALRGETLTETIRHALEKRLSDTQLNRGRAADKLARLQDIARAAAALPVLDHRSEDEILGYNENGLFD